MRTMRQVGFLFFALTIIMTPARLRADVSCDEIVCNGIPGTYGGHFCFSDLEPPGASNCNEFRIHCDVYCGSYGGTGAFDCVQTEFGLCTCNDQQTCCYGEQEYCYEGSDCCTGYCHPESNSCQPPPQSPILIDLHDNSAAYELTDAAHGVAFDIDADGDVDQMAWTQASSPIAFLMLDRNSNGIVDDGSELFGNHTRKADGTEATDGFDALSDLDGDSDGSITASDASYSLLRLWLDANHDGESEISEFLTLQEASVTSLSTKYEISRRRDRHGNQYKLVGKAIVSKNGKIHERRMFDVFFTMASMRTR